MRRGHGANSADNPAQNRLSAPLASDQEGVRAYFRNTSGASNSSPSIKIKHTQGANRCSRMDASASDFRVWERWGVLLLATPGAPESASVARWVQPRFSFVNSVR